MLASMNKLLAKLNFKKKRQDKERNKLVLTGAIALLAGFLIAGLPGSSPNPNYPLASSQELQRARQDIEDAYLKASSTDCNDPSDPIAPAERVDVFKQYLKINRFGNRAVIRGCNNIDSLLYKDHEGVWQTSTVNVNLDSRANPIWQSECLIDDITEADDTLRPENSTIDIFNLIACRQLDETAQVRKIMEAGSDDGSGPDVEDIKSVINAAQKWSNL